MHGKRGTDIETRKNEIANEKIYTNTQPAIQSVNELASIHDNNTQTLNVFFKANMVNEWRSTFYDVVIIYVHFYAQPVVNFDKMI